MPKLHSEQFKSDAVALYENNENLSLAAAVAELGVNRASLHQWKKEFGTGKRTRMTEAKAQAESVSDTKRIRALERKTPNYAKNEIFCAGLRNILPTRHAGNPLLSLSKTIAPNIRSSGCVRS